MLNLQLTVSHYTRDNVFVSRRGRDGYPSVFRICCTSRPHSGTHTPVWSNTHVWRTRGAARCSPTPSSRPHPASIREHTPRQLRDLSTPSARLLGGASSFSCDVLSRRCPLDPFGMMNMVGGYALDPGGVSFGVTESRWCAPDVRVGLSTLLSSERKRPTEVGRL
jgi:hypothetical protein